MKILHTIFCNFWVIIPVGLIYAISCGLATFIENDYGTLMANAIIYRSFWFNILHAYFALALIMSFIFSTAWKEKRYAVILLHFSFVLIIIGAAITRFFAFEGTMHIREGGESFNITASEPSINIMAVSENGDKEFYFLNKVFLGIFGKQDERIYFFNKPLELSEFEVKKPSGGNKSEMLEVSFKACYDTVCRYYRPLSDIGMGLQFEPQDFNGVRFFISYGPRDISLPFGLRLKKFDLEHYPGSMSPSSYASEVEILNVNGDVIKPYRIFMNNVLDFQGYRFYQSSYDQDEKGTILSVNRDPGKNITYFGYGLLIFGAILILFAKNGRFQVLARFLQNQKIACFTLMLLSSLSLQQSLRAEDKTLQDLELSNDQKVDFLQTFARNSKDHTKEFSKLQLQNFSGRIEPVDTIANQVIHKITHKTTLFNMNENQLFLGMILYPQIFKDLKMIFVGKDDHIKEILGLKKSDSFASFSDFYSQSIGYKLNNYVQEANRKDPAKRDNFDKNILKIDERVNLVYAIFSGSFLRIFPIQNSDLNGAWLDPLNIARMGNEEIAHEVSRLLGNIFKAFDNGIFRDNWDGVIPALQAVSAYQKEYSQELYLSATKVHAEMFLNSSNIFSKLIIPYLIVGFLFLISVIVSMLKNKSLSKNVKTLLYVLACVCGLAHTIALILRWYVSNHSPWSNAYESMLYIAWAAAMAGLVFFRRYPLAISAALFLAGISLFVANLGFMDPQITPLVPVLKSYWLNIHVSVITASYGFFGLCFILGVMSLVLFIFRSPYRSNIDNSIYSLYALNEMAMILGLMFLSVGNFLGGVWANESWGRYWSWDAKETWALISIIIYSIVLHLRFMGIKNMPYVFSVASMFAFYVILMTYFGVNYYLAGMHSYAAGDPVPVPTFVYYFIGLNMLLIVLSARKSHLRVP